MQEAEPEMRGYRGPYKGFPDVIQEESHGLPRGIAPVACSLLT